MRFGTWIVKMLAANGVDTVFGIPGVHTIELYRGFAGSDLRHVTARHEQGAGFMADGYARASGRPGVCFIITGPGLTNIATAMGQAYGDSIPMLVISTVNSVGAIGSGAGHLHELPDQRGLMAGVSAFSHTILAIEEFSTVLARAFAVFASARPRPVHIEIPVSLLAADTSALGPPRKLAVPTRPAAAEAALAAAVEECGRSKAPLIVVGGGAVAAAGEVRALAEQLDAPVLMTTNGRGILDGQHLLALPLSPGSEAGSMALREADLILAIGTELGPTDFEDAIADRRSLAARLLRCDIDPEQVMRGRLPDIAVVADAADFARALAGRLPTRQAGSGASRAARIRGALQVSLAPRQRAALRLLEILRDCAPGSLIVGDSTQPVYAACLGFAASVPRQFFCSATGYGTLGYGLPAAIGARLARPEGGPVFALVGDGGLQFSLPEMGAAVEANAAVVAILWNNRGYGEIKSAMETAAISPVGVDIHVPDFRALARGFGWTHRKADDIAMLAVAIAEAVAARRPALIEIDEQRFSRSCE